MPGTLYVVATPIGNLEDITLRALRVLKEADCIAAEDTRHTKKLLTHYDIHTPLTSYHEHNERAAAPALVQRMLHGESMALVTDAGTPGISDPGYRLVIAALAAGIQVTPIPGASALIAALGTAALPTDRFVFEGFLPEKRKQRRERLLNLRDEQRTLVCYEAPHRLKETLGDIADVLGERDVVIAREMTKLHEEFMRGPLREILTGIAEREMRGEVVILVQGAASATRGSEESLRKEVLQLRAGGMRVKEIADLLGEKYALPKKYIYRLALELGKVVNR